MNLRDLIRDWQADARDGDPQPLRMESDDVTPDVELLAHMQNAGPMAVLKTLHTYLHDHVIEKGNAASIVTGNLHQLTAVTTGTAPSSLIQSMAHAIIDIYMRCADEDELELVAEALSRMWMSSILMLSGPKWTQH